MTTSSPFETIMPLTIAHAAHFNAALAAHQKAKDEADAKLGATQEYLVELAAVMNDGDVYSLDPNPARLLRKVGGKVEYIIAPAAADA